MGKIHRCTTLKEKKGNKVNMKSNFPGAQYINYAECRRKIGDKVT